METLKLDLRLADGESIKIDYDQGFVTLDIEGQDAHGSLVLTPQEAENLGKHLGKLTNWIYD